MQCTQPIAPLSVALFKEGETISPPVVSSDLSDSTLPVTSSALTYWPLRLLATSAVALQPLVARLSDHALVAVLRLLPPDFPILVILANLCGWEGL